MKVKTFSSSIIIIGIISIFLGFISCGANAPPRPPKPLSKEKTKDTKPKKSKNKKPGAQG